MSLRCGLLLWHPVLARMMVEAADAYPLAAQVAALVVTSRLASPSMQQCKLGIGSRTSVDLMQLLER